MSNSYAVGGFARGLTRGIEAGQLTRARQHGLLQQKRMREGQRVLDETAEDYTGTFEQDQPAIPLASAGNDRFDYKPQQAIPLQGAANPQPGAALPTGKVNPSNYSSYSTLKQKRLKAARKVGEQAYATEYARFNEMEKGMVRGIMLQGRAGIEANDPLAMKETVEQIKQLYPALRGMEAKVTENGLEVNGTPVNRDTFVQMLVAIPEIQDMEGKLIEMQNNLQDISNKKSRQTYLEASADYYAWNIEKDRELFPIVKAAERLKVDTANLQLRLMDEQLKRMEAEGLLPKSYDLDAAKTATNNDLDTFQKTSFADDLTKEAMRLFEINGKAVTKNDPTIRTADDYANAIQGLQADILYGAHFAQQQTGEAKMMNPYDAWRLGNAVMAWSTRQGQAPAIQKVALKNMPGFVALVMDTGDELVVPENSMTSRRFDYGLKLLKDQGEPDPSEITAKERIRNERMRNVQESQYALDLGGYGNPLD